jgi:uncharacterized membrane protein
MNDLSANETVVPGAAELQSLKNTTLLVYVLQALSFLGLITAVVGLVISYVKREDAKGTIYESHINWQIKTFWWGLLWFVVGCITSFLIVGFGVLFAVWVWVIYRVTKGWLKLNEGKAVAPASAL